MKKDLIKYTPTNEQFIIWFAVKHHILFKIFQRKCALDLISGKMTIKEATEEQKELAKLYLEKKEIDKKIEERKRDLKNDEKKGE